MLRTGKSVAGIPVGATPAKRAHLPWGPPQTPISIVIEFLYRG